MNISDINILIYIYIYINICIVFSMLRPHGEILYAWGTAIFWVSCYIVASFGCQANMAAEHSTELKGFPRCQLVFPLPLVLVKPVSYSQQLLSSIANHYQVPVVVHILFPLFCWKTSVISIPSKPFLVSTDLVTKRRPLAGPSTVAHAEHPPGLWKEVVHSSS